VRYSFGVGKIVPNCSNLLPWLEVGLFLMSCAKRKLEANKNKLQAKEILFIFFDDYYTYIQ